MFAKVAAWWGLTVSIATAPNHVHGISRRLDQLSLSVWRVYEDHGRDDLRVEHFEAFVARILGVFYSTISHHRAVRTLVLGGYGLEAFMVLRAQLEATVILDYLVEPGDDHDEVLRRVDRYVDWVIIHQYKNMERSNRFSVVREIPMTDGYRKSVKASYKEIEKRRTPEDMLTLRKLLTFPGKACDVAGRHGYDDLYDHIYAESSTSIHAGDIGDRMWRQDRPGFHGYSYHLGHHQSAFWPLLMSNMVQFTALRAIGEFFGIESQLQPKLFQAWGREFRDVRNRAPGEAPAS